MEEQILEKLKEIQLFAELKSDEKALQLLLEIGALKKYKAGEVVFNEGDVGSEMYIVYAGAVEIVKKTRAGDDYTVVLLEAEDNVFFGEMALISDENRSATVIASQDSLFLVIAKEDFLRLGNAHPAIGLPITRAISKILAARLRKTTIDMLTLFDALVHEIRG